ncbi:MAG: Cytidine and deoxycytidylate deaminase zinc-binding region [Alphaproteobacteria bacterium ADurb.Bin438]|nr:MAG: Cytidine and deoxycytidylate deaminase zinc-binding region [Alphaproteobacteria bacterium ADurb.Bin438]
MENKWHNRFFELAKLISTWSKDPSSKTAAIIVDDEHRIISTGYNGFSRGVNDDEARYENREVKYEIIVHAEVNAIMNALGKDLKGTSMYIYPYLPCTRCASQIIQAGIKKIYAPKADMPERWLKNLNLAKQILTEAGVEIEEIKI